MGYRRSRGLTLLELVITLAVFAITVGMVVPTFQDLVVRNRVTTATNLFIASLHLARSEAARTGEHASLCPGDATGCRDDGYETGWIVFRDANRDGQRQAGEPVIRAVEEADGAVTVRGNATVDEYITYTPRGYTRLASGGFQAGTVTICRPPHARRIVLSRTGRPRTEITTC